MIATIPGIAGYWQAGDSGQHVHTKRLGGYDWIERIDDSSGRLRHLTNTTGKDEPGYRTGLTLSASEGGPYTTTRTMISIHKFADNKQVYANVLTLPAPLTLNKEFTLFVVAANSRSNALRDIWCSQGSGGISEGLRWDQGSNGALWLTIAGLRKKVCSTLPMGPLIIEVTRGPADAISVIVNGKNRTVSGLPAMPGNLVLTTWGHDLIGGHSHFDDFAFETAIVSWPLSDTNRLAARSFWAGRWDIPLEV